MLLRILNQWKTVTTKVTGPSRKGGKTIDLYCYIKVLKVKPVYQQMTLSPKLGVVGISTLWHFRLPLPIQMFTKVASSPRLSGIGMPSPILWSHPLKMQRIVLLSSLLWWELGTNSLITGPGEWLSFRRFTSKLSWSWSIWYEIGLILIKGRKTANQFYFLLFKLLYLTINIKISYKSSNQCTGEPLVSSSKMFKIGHLKYVSTCWFSLIFQMPAFKLDQWHLLPLL